MAPRTDPIIASIDAATLPQGYIAPVGSVVVVLSAGVSGGEYRTVRVVADTTDAVPIGEVAPDGTETTRRAREREAVVSTSWSDVDERGRAAGLVRSWRNVWESRCAATPIGWILSAERYAEAAKAAAPILAAIAEHNAIARYTRADVSVLPLRLDAAITPQAAAAIGGHVSAALAEIRGLIDAGPKSLPAIDKALRAARTLPQLASGLQGDLIIAALDAAKIARDLARDAGKAGADWAPILAGLDLSALDGAAAAFDPATQAQAWGGI